MPFTAIGTKRKKNHIESDPEEDDSEEDTVRGTLYTHDDVASDVDSISSDFSPNPQQSSPESISDGSQTQSLGQSQDSIGQQYPPGLSPSFGSDSEMESISSDDSQNDMHPGGDGADLASSADAEIVDYFGIRLPRVHVELLDRWITKLMKARSVTHQPSQKAAKKYYWQEVPHAGTHGNKACKQRAEMTQKFAEEMFDAHCRAQYRDGGHGASLFNRMATDRPGRAARVLLNNPTEPETASLAALIQRIIPMCLEFEAEESARKSWEDTSVDVKPGATDVSINGMCARPTTEQGKQKLHDALTSISMGGETGNYTFKRGVSETQTIKIIAQRRDDLISILGAPELVFAALNAIEGHEVTYVGATDFTDATEPYVIMRAMQDYGGHTHGNLTRIFEVPGSAEKLTSIHVVYVVLSALSTRPIDRVEQQLTSMLGTNPLSSARVGVEPVKTFQDNFGHQSQVGDGKVCTYIVMPNVEFVEHCNDLFSPSGALCRNYSGIPYSGPYAGATMHRLDEMKTELRKQIALMQPSLSALQ